MKAGSISEVTVFQRATTSPTCPDDVDVLSVAIEYTALSSLTSVALPVVSKWQRRPNKARHSSPLFHTHLCESVEERLVCHCYENAAWRGCRVTL